MNTLRTILLMGVLTALIVSIGNYFGGQSGMMIAFAFAVTTNLFSFWFSDKIALSMSRAQPIARDEAPGLYEIVEHLSQRAGIPAPRIYVIPSESPNAFATGRDPRHSSIAVTAGIMRLLNRHELEGVLAHELAHVRNRDVLITTMAAVLASVVTMIAHWGMWYGGYRDDRDRGGSVNPLFGLLLALLAPFAAMLINLAISRAREFQADASGADICGHPDELASALSKLESGAQDVPYRDANPALASLYIVNPDPSSWFVNLFSTHPPIVERIARLEAMKSHSDGS